MSEWEPKIAVFLCQWSLKSDAAWEQRLDLAENVRVVQAPCSGRINPLLLISALQHGADGVLVVGCEPGHCHYKEGNYVGRRKFATLHSFLQLLGVKEERIRFVWLSETESCSYPEQVKRLQRDIQELGPFELARRETIPCVVPARSVAE